VSLPHEDLPDLVKQDPKYDPGESYGAILPALVVSGRFTVVSYREIL
jgi:hypothetical protein